MGEVRAEDGKRLELGVEEVFSGVNERGWCG